MRRRDPDHYEPRRDELHKTEEGPKFGPPRPDLDRGMRGEKLTGEAGAYGPRSDMMEYGGFEQGSYDRHRNYYEGYQSSDDPDPVKAGDGDVEADLDEDDSGRVVRETRGDDDVTWPRFVSHAHPDDAKH